MQPDKPTDCHHSPEPFNASFAVVASRSDISSDAKLVHALHVSMHRLDASWTQAEMGERLGMCRTRVWDAQQELVRAGLLISVRIGLGQPNAYVVLGVDQESLDGSGDPASGGRTVGKKGAGQSGRGNGVSLRKKEMTKNGEYKLPPEHARSYTEGRYAHLVKR